MSAQTGGKAPTDSVSLGDLVTTAGFLVGLAAAWLYLAGWTYAYHYFDRFGVPLLMLDIPYEHILVYGFLVLRAQLWWALAIGVLGVLLTMFWPVVTARTPRRMQLAAAVMVVALLLALGFLGAVATARADYLDQRGSDYSAFPRVKVVLDPKTVQAATDLDPAALAKGCHRLLLQNNDRLFLIRPFKGAPAADLAALVVSLDAVEALRVLPDYTSCP